MFKQWNATDGSAVVTNDDATGVVSWGFDLNKELGAGGLVCGTGSVNGFVFADLSQYTKISFTGTAAAGKTLILRILYNRVGADGSTAESQIDISSGTGELDIAALNLTYFHLNAIKVAWNNNGGTVTSIKLTKPTDPYEVPKATLKIAIDKGKLQNSFAKTTASWQALQDAISDGEKEYANPTSTEALNAAVLAIENAIAGFEYQPGYSKLTKEMANANVDYVLNKSTGLPYGTNNVDKNVYADLSAYDKLIVVASAGVPRFCMNRQTADGQIGATKAESNMIDINTQGDYASNTWATDAYLTVDEKVYTVDLTKISDDWNGEVKLHCIKGWNYANVTVTDMLLYRAPKAATIGSDGYATFSTDKAVKIQGVEAYAAKLNGNTVTLLPVTEVPANTAVILKGAADNYNFTILDAAAALSENDLQVSDGSVTGNGSIYVLANTNSVPGFYKLASGQKVPAGKAYLTKSGSAPEFLPFEGGVTGIETVKAAKANNEIFNLAGQRVAQPAKGLYIVNGKKVVVK